MILGSVWPFHDKLQDLFWKFLLACKSSSGMGICIEIETRRSSGEYYQGYVP